MPDDAAPPPVTSGDIYTRIRDAYPFEKGWITRAAKREREILDGGA